MIEIREVKSGDERILAFIHAESWRAAFGAILDPEVLEKSVREESLTAKYKKILDEKKGHGYVLEVNGEPQGMAWWDRSRDEGMPGYAELICIHSFQAYWNCGYGSRLMERIFKEASGAGYPVMMLWVFADNIRAISFYKKHGFRSGGRLRERLGATEEMYIKHLKAEPE